MNLTSTKSEKRNSKVYKKCPTVTQIQSTECGPASLSMLLGHYGLFVNLQALTKECGVTRDGSKGSTLITVAKSYELILKPKRLSLETLKEKNNMPCIAFWNASHWIVIEGYDDNGFYINDPASGRRYEYNQKFGLGRYQP